MNKALRDEQQLDKGSENENPKSPSSLLSPEQMLENDVRSNLRYCWQKAMSFAAYYKPTIQEILDELTRAFLCYIPKRHPARKQFQKALYKVFKEMLGELLSTEDLRSEQLENLFIEKAINEFRPLL